MTLLPLLGQAREIKVFLLASSLTPSLKFTNTERGSQCDWALVSQLPVVLPAANEQEIAPLYT